MTTMIRSDEVPRLICRNSCAAWHDKTGCRAFTAGHGNCANPNVKRKDDGHIQHQTAR